MTTTNTTNAAAAMQADHNIDAAAQRGPSTNRNQTTYKPATHYRIFIRRRDEETRELKLTIHGAWLTIEEADKARYQLRRDEWSYVFVCPGDADPACSGVISRGEQIEIIREEGRIAQREGANE